MFWYVGIRAWVEVDPTNNPGEYTECPGESTSVVWDPPCAILVHVYDSGDDSCLVGTVEALDPVPSGWTAKTLAEAQTHFQTKKGRAATSLEVF